MNKVEAAAFRNKMHKGKYGLYISEEMWEEKCKDIDTVIADHARLLAALERVANYGANGEGDGTSYAADCDAMRDIARAAVRETWQR